MEILNDFSRKRIVPSLAILALVVCLCGCCGSVLADEWKQAIGPWTWVFPRDHGAHPEFRGGGILLGTQNSPKTFGTSSPSGNHLKPNVKQPLVRARLPRALHLTDRTPISSGMESLPAGTDLQG
jgi:hypothetical protein